MRSFWALGLSFMVLAGCSEPGPEQGGSTKGQVSAADVHSLVLEHGPIRFADGTGIELGGVVQQEIFAKAPDASKQFRYQKGVRRTVRFIFAESQQSVMSSISDVMKKGGYGEKVTEPKEGVKVVRFVKKGFPAVNVRFETVAAGKDAQQQTAVIFNWII